MDLEFGRAAPAVSPVFIGGRPTPSPPGSALQHYPAVFPDAPSVAVLLAPKTAEMSAASSHIGPAPRKQVTFAVVSVLGGLTR